MTDKDIISQKGNIKCIFYNDNICRKGDRTRDCLNCARVEYKSLYRLNWKSQEQLELKTQECESLKQEIEILQNNYDTATRDCNEEIARLEQECEQTKEKYEALKLENQEGYEIVAELKHECDELEKQLKTSEKWRVKSESLNEKLDIENTRYHKALEEIEGLVKNFCKDCGDYENCNWDKEGCYYSLIPNLKDIINKAKGEE